MADGRPATPRPAAWTEIFRCFQIALDPRKLLVAAAGILVMSFLWWLLSVIFYYKAPNPNADEYSKAVVGKSFEGRNNPQTGKPYTNEELEAAIAAEAQSRYQADFEQWKVLDSLAGPGGRLRTLPWYEYRGPNPFLLLTDLIGGTAADRTNAVSGFIYGSIPVLIEPLVKLLIPVAKLIAPGVSPLTRFYLFLVLLANIAVWAFCGGIITRIAAVQLANKGPISLMQAFRFVRNRYLSYLGAPLVPLAIITACVVGLIIYGFLALIPFFGDIFFLGIGLPIVIIGGAVMAVFLVGLAGYPLMYPTLSAEGDQSDTFDALSRSINYVYQCPWQYLWYWLVAILYGAAVTFFVLFFASLTVYVGKWAVGLTSSTVWTDRKPEFLFIYAPESFEWRMLLTKDSPYEIQPAGGTGWVTLNKDGNPTTNPAEGIRQVYRYEYKDEAAAKQAFADSSWYRNYYTGAAIVCFWLTLLFLMMLGFSYSFFWSAATIIYFLMRKRVDEAELDEVFIEEEEEPQPPPSTLKLAEGTTAAPATSLPVIPTPPGPAAPPAPPASAADPATPPAPQAPPPVSTLPATPPTPAATSIPDPPAPPPFTHTPPAPPPFTHTPTAPTVPEALPAPTVPETPPEPPPPPTPPAMTPFHATPPSLETPKSEEEPNKPVDNPPPLG